MRLFSFRFHAMAAQHELQMYARDEATAHRVAQLAIADVERIEVKYSRYREDSVTTAINRAAGGDAVAIDAETAALLRYADRCFTASDGGFDLTSGVLRRAWDFRAQPPRVPHPREIDAARACIGWQRVEWSDRAVRLPDEGMEIDFGGIGKEYAADRVATIVAEQGIAHALVNLGGDVRAVGPQADDAPWRVGIRHPRRETEVIALVELRGGAVATSGDYQRYFEIAGRRYCHILDPRTGMPVAHWRSVSVVAPLCVVAGSFATLAMLRGPDAAAFLDAQGVEWLGVDAAGELCGTLRGQAESQRDA